MENGKRNDVIPGAVPPEKPPVRRSVRLRNARDARRFLAKIANQLYRAEIAEGRAGRLAYVLQVFVRSIEVDEIERRLDALERVMTTERRIVDVDLRKD